MTASSLHSVGVGTSWGTPSPPAMRPGSPDVPRAALQSDARENRRRHAMRNAARFCVLFLLDGASVVAAMLLLLLADPEDGLGKVVRWNDPSVSALSVLAQNVIAVCGGLFLMNAYDEGDARRDVGRVMSGVSLGLLFLHWPLLWHDASTLLTNYLPSVVLYGIAVMVTRLFSDRSLGFLWQQLGTHGRTLFVGRPEEVEAAMQRSPMRGLDALIPAAQLDLSSAIRLAHGNENGHAHGNGIGKGNGHGHVNGNGNTNGNTNGNNNGNNNGNGLGVVCCDDACSAVAEQLQASIHAYAVDTTLLCSQFNDDELAEIVGISEAAGCRVISLSRTYSVSRLSPTLRTYDHTPVVELTQPGIRGRDLLLKRAFDLVASALLLLLFAPVMLVVAILVKQSSPGPVFFRQSRVGYAGTMFRMLKFRSMRDGADALVDTLRNESMYGDPRLFKVEHDPRVTRLGRFLRRSSIDELPQLFNVLCGSMSLVGPRPPVPREVALYGDHSFLRFDVKPGITGPWQVNGRNRVTSFEDVIALEAAYVSGWTIWRDFAILARTIPVVLRMDGAH